MQILQEKVISFSTVYIYDFLKPSIKVYEGSLSDATKGESMSNYFYDLPTSSKRRNRYIFPSNAAGSLRIVNLPELFGRARFRVSPPTYIYPRRWLFFMVGWFSQDISADLDVGDS